MVFQKIEYYKISKEQLLTNKQFFPRNSHCKCWKSDPMLNKDGALVSFAKKNLHIAEYPAPRPAPKQYYHFIVFPLKIKAEMQMQCNGS